MPLHSEGRSGEYSASPWCYVRKYVRSYTKIHNRVITFYARSSLWVMPWGKARGQNVKRVRLSIWIIHVVVVIWEKETAGPFVFFGHMSSLKTYVFVR